MKKTLLFLLVVASFATMSVDVVYSPEQANQMLKSKLPMIQTVAKQYGLEDRIDEALAPAFPEHIKYSGAKDVLEKGINRSIAGYKEHGLRWMKFSEEYSQQGPEFQEKFSEILAGIPMLAEKYPGIARIHSLPEMEKRIAVLDRIGNDTLQTENLFAFLEYRDYQEKFHRLKLSKEARAVRNGTAYAYGLHLTETELAKREHYAYFPYGGNGELLSYGYWCEQFITTYAAQLFNEKTAK